VDMTLYVFLFFNLLWSTMATQGCLLQLQSNLESLSHPIKNNILKPIPHEDKTQENIRYLNVQWNPRQPWVIAAICGPLDQSTSSSIDNLLVSRATGLRMGRVMSKNIVWKTILEEDDYDPLIKGIKMKISPEDFLSTALLWNVTGDMLALNALRRDRSIPRIMQFKENGLNSLWVDDSSLKDIFVPRFWITNSLEKRLKVCDNAQRCFFYKEGSGTWRPDPISDSSLFKQQPGTVIKYLQVNKEKIFGFVYIVDNIKRKYTFNVVVLDGANVLPAQEYIFPSGQSNVQGIRQADISQNHGKDDYVIAYILESQHQRIFFQRIQEGKLLSSSSVLDVEGLQAVTWRPQRGDFLVGRINGEDNEIILYQYQHNKDPLRIESWFLSQGTAHKMVRLSWSADGNYFSVVFDDGSLEIYEYPKPRHPTWDD